MFSNDDAIELDHLAARHGRGRLRPRHIVRVAVVDVAVAGARLVAIVEERSGADGLAHLLVRIGLGILLAHHVAERGRDRGQAVDHEPIGRAQHDAEGLVVDDRGILHAPHQRLAGAAAGGPATHRGDAVGRRHRGAVGELQAITQLERIGELVVGHAPAGHHLRLRREIGVEAEQRVVDHPAVVGADVRGGPDRIEHAQVRMHDGLDGARGRRLRLSPDDGRRGGESREPAGQYAAPCRCHG